VPPLQPPPPPSLPCIPPPPASSLPCNPALALLHLPPLISPRRGIHGAALAHPPANLAAASMAPPSPSTPRVGVPLPYGCLATVKSSMAAVADGAEGVEEDVGASSSMGSAAAESPAASPSSMGSAASTGVTMPPPSPSPPPPPISQRHAIPARLSLIDARPSLQRSCLSASSPPRRPCSPPAPSLTAAFVGLIRPRNFRVAPNPCPHRAQRRRCQRGPHDGSFSASNLLLRRPRFLPLPAPRQA
jgi:hypothetical protein